MARLETKPLGTLPPATGKSAAIVVSPASVLQIPVDKKGRKRKWLAGLVVVALIVAAGLIVRSRMTQETAVLNTAPITRGSIQAFVTATGNLNPVVNVQVGSQVSGNIKALYADFNTKVTKGQLIAQIDPEIFQAQVDNAAASVAQQEANVAQADAQVARASSDMSAALANRNSAEAVAAKDSATLENLLSQWRRVAALYELGIISAQERDAAKASYEAAVAQLAADRSQVESAGRTAESAQAQMVAAKAQSGAASAQLRAAQAVHAQAKINLEHTRIVAPVSGTVIARHFDVGQTVAASFQAPDIFDIGEDLTKMQVDTSVDEADVGTVAPGQQAVFSVDAYPGREFHGIVGDVRKAPIIAQNVVTYDVVIMVANPDLKLFPGMTAKVTVLTEKVDNSLKVPNTALRFRPGPEVSDRLKTASNLPADAQKVYVLSGRDIDIVPVQTGITDGKFTAVSSSLLKEGDRVVLGAKPPQGLSAKPAHMRRLPGT